jgi:hypothetical protein
LENSINEGEMINTQNDELLITESYKKSKLDKNSLTLIYEVEKKFANGIKALKKSENEPTFQLKKFGVR